MRTKVLCVRIRGWGLEYDGEGKVMEVEVRFGWHLRSLGSWDVEERGLGLWLLEGIALI